MTGLQPDLNNFNIFEFVRLIEWEHFPFSIKRTRDCSGLQMEIDAFYEKWSICFDTGGIVRYHVTDEYENRNRTVKKPLSDLFNRPVRAWMEASKDLNIEFIHPYRFKADANKVFTVSGLLPQFGFKKGALILSRRDSAAAHKGAEDSGDFFISALNPFYYDRYDRTRFIETLRDWRWNSGEKAPEWLDNNV